MTHILKAVIEDGIHATGRNAQAFTRNEPRGPVVRPAAGKTGTTEYCVDAWFVGYTPDLAVAVWVGYDDNISLGENRQGLKMTGGRVACPIWAEFMLEALGDKQPKDFTIPENVVVVGSEAYLAGTEPKVVAAS